MKTLTRIPVLYPTEHLPELNRAAKAEGLSRSNFVVRTMRDVLNQEAVTGKLFRSQSFRVALAEMVTRPGVMSVLSEAMQADPGTLKQVQEQIVTHFAKESKRTSRLAKPTTRTKRKAR